jgi:hypothetical protein
MQTILYQAASALCGVASAVSPDGYSSVIPIWSALLQRIQDQNLQSIPQLPVRRNPCRFVLTGLVCASGSGCPVGHLLLQRGAFGVVQEALGRLLQAREASTSTWRIEASMRGEFSANAVYERSDGCTEWERSEVSHDECLPRKNRQRLRIPAWVTTCYRDGFPAHEQNCSLSWLFLPGKKAKNHPLQPPASRPISASIHWDGVPPTLLDKFVW